jgi:hypothetical protein
MSSMTPEDDDAAMAARGFYQDERFADDDGNVPWFRPEPALPGESAQEWAAKEAADAEFDLLLAAWEAKHEGPDVVQDLPSWRADREAELDAADADEAGL